MPGFNQTGPQGKGALTGRGRGRCSTTKSEIKVNSQATTPENEEIPVADKGTEVYGVGMGGRPYGGGRGNCFGGGRRRKGFGRWQGHGQI